VQLLVGDVIPNGSIDGGRATGFTAHPNDLGALTGSPSCSAHAGVTTANCPCHERGSYVLLLLRGRADSVRVRGRFVAAGAAIVVWLAFQRISMHALLAIAALATCVVALVTLQSLSGAPDPLERLESATTHSSLPGGATQLAPLDQRIRTYRVAEERIQEDPFVGLGLDLFSATRAFGDEA
jgi:hypothetical protein